MQLAELITAMERTTPLPSLPDPAERRRLRIESGVTIVEAAAVLGVGDVTLSAYEHGARTPRTKNLHKYRTLLAVFNEKAAR